MGRVCGVKHCNSGSAADTKRRHELNLRKPGFFKVPESPTKRQKWIDSLSTDLSDRQYVCDLHFENNSIQDSYLTNLSSGEISKIMKGRITRTQESVPVIVNEIRSPIIEDCTIQVFRNEVSDNPESPNQNDHNQEQQQQRAIGEHQGNCLNEASDNLEFQKEDEQEQQPQKIERQFNDDDMRIENLEQSHLVCQDNDPIDKNVPQRRLVTKRKLSYPDENVTVKRQKNSEPEIDYTCQINFYDDVEILSIIIELNKLFPIGWSFIPGINKLIAIQFDRIKFKERVRLIVNEDQSVLVTFSEHYKQKIDAQIQSVNDLINYLKYMEQKKLCTGTGFDVKSYSFKCHGDVSDIYKRTQACPRCSECRKLRLKLQKFKKGQTPNIVENIQWLDVRFISLK